MKSTPGFQLNFSTYSHQVFLFIHRVIRNSMRDVKNIFNYGNEVGSGGRDLLWQEGSQPQVNKADKKKIDSL